ncbi:FAD/NAD(P)-binding domain-containing protein [Irpex rosettiformis]|uniref:FAD/NAD(P)-binding domain-containing protein n=1 Tax=Irpex rosettiformis TaxID=378272 RepID=A0ACB8U0U3_9APHY|nr:FAD/NAD(P)-binding domain-containing protein [Irpex rosettiformis]
MKVAVVGSGVSGLAATWLLNEYSDHEVHLYEADNRPGGHANTISFKKDTDGLSVDVDAGFIVFNPTTYPNFLRFLHLHPSLASAIQPTNMTFSVSRDDGAFEWAGNANGLKAFFTSWRRALDPGMWRLAYDILRFNACARRVVMRKVGGSDEEEEETSVGEYLKSKGYSDTFRDNYLLPMTAAIWSTPPEKCALEFPIKTLVRFMSNHYLLQLTGKPSWLTLRGGSKVYVNQILSALPPAQLHLSTSVKSISTLLSPPHSRVELETSTGLTEIYDHVILATHSNDTLRIISSGHGATQDQREQEEKILSTFRWNRNDVVVHSDTKLMPKNQMTWSCWNYLARSSSIEDPKARDKPENDGAEKDVNRMTLTYWMNVLQDIPIETYGPVLVTLNPLPGMEPHPESIAAKFEYDHPAYDSKTIQAQKLLHTIQATRGVSYAGAYWRYGFHEDGFTSGLKAALDACQVLGGVPGDDEMEGEGEEREKAQFSQLLKTSVRPPFEIKEADCDPDPVWAEVVFDLLEMSGIRWIFWWIFGVVLMTIRCMVELLVAPV